MASELLLRWPNLGHPCLVRVYKNQDTTFKVIFGAKQNNLDVKSSLRGRLFLQTLSDTRQIFQDGRPASVWSVDNVPDSIRHRLIPVNIENVESPVESHWYPTPVISPKHVNFEPDPGFPQGYLFAYACWVTLRVESRYIRCLNHPQLLNLIYNSPGGGVNVNFHSVYIHEKKWHDFKFIHATDTHVSMRNDLIPDKLAQMPKFDRKKYINFNENFRQFIKYANTLHRKGELDFILLTGDIIDYIFEDQALRPYSIWEERPHQIDNFEFFRDLVIARVNNFFGEKIKIVVGEELEVPLYTVLGNHDYRLNEYPLIFDIELFWKTMDTRRAFGSFGLTEDEAKAFEGGIRSHGPKASGTFVSYFEGIEGYYPLPPHYAMIINPDADYIIRLGKHRIVCMDTGHDEEAVKDISDYVSVHLTENESGLNFLGGSPDSVGFAEDQIKLLKNAVKETKGLLILAFHAPMVNTRETPHHLIRETEHNRTLTDIEKKELLAFILVNRPETPAWQVVKYVVLGPVAGVLDFFADIFTKIFGKSPMEKMRDDGWPFGKSDVFKVGARDPYLGWGVADHGFNEFLETIESRITQDETATLILTGHTHKNIEYVVTFRGYNKMIRYYHDYYVDNTIHGQRPQDYWTSEDIPDYDPTSQKPKNVMWHHCSPLFVQTLCLGPKPSHQKPNHEKAKLIGYSKVNAGKFSLYDIKQGTYRIDFLSHDKKEVAFQLIDISDDIVTGKKIINLTLQIKTRDPGKAYKLGTLGKGSLKNNWGQGNVLVVKGTINENKRIRLISGTIAVYKAPPPEGGVLHVTVQNDVIADIKRVYLSDMAEEKEPSPRPNSAYFILSTSPP